MPTDSKHAHHLHEPVPAHRLVFCADSVSVTRFFNKSQIFAANGIFHWIFCQICVIIMGALVIEIQNVEKA